MKRYFIFFLFLGLSACDEGSQEEGIFLNASKIIGSWQLTEAYVSPGAGATWQSVEDGDIYKFDIDGTFSQFNTYKDTSNRTGSFTYENESLKLTFTIDGEEKWQSFSVDIVEDKMTISPTGPTICVEACLYRYNRLE